MFICRLCGTMVESLVDSHLLPRSAYKRINVNRKKIVQIKYADNAAFYDQKQISTPLLCNSCEDLFSKNGETQMGLLWMNKNEFPMLHHLERCSQIADGSYDGNDLPKNICDALIYFAISIIWRGSVWPDDRLKSYKGSLGKKYESEFRSFLLGKGRLSNVKFFIYASSSHNDARCKIMTLPSLEPGPIGKSHFFYILGFRFCVIIGRTHPKITNLFQHLKSDLLLSVVDEKNSNWQKDIWHKVLFSLERKGTLAKDYPRS